MKVWHDFHGECTVAYPEGWERVNPLTHVTLIDSDGEKIYVLKDALAVIEPEALVETGTLLNDLADECLEIARSKGFYPKGEPVNIDRALLLIVSEAVEAQEELRCDRYENVEKELADILIRTLSLMSVLEMDVDRLVSEKMQQNRGREFRHGKKW